MLGFLERRGKRSKERTADKMPIAFVAGGGTIGSLLNNDGVRCAGENQLDLIEGLGKKFPEFAKNIKVESSFSAFGGLSENMTPQIQAKFKAKILEAIDSGATNIVVSHGTDSLEHTARYLFSQLQEQLRQKGVRVVITAANQDTSHPRTDAWNNLRLAISTASDASQQPGVFVAFHNLVIPGDRVVKEPYNGREMNYTDEESEEYIQSLKQQERHEQQQIQQFEEKFKVSTESNQVAICEVNKTDLDLSIDQFDGQRVVIFKLYHSGTARTEGSNSVDDFIAQLTNQGIICLGVTENGEPTNLHGYETGVALDQAGLRAIPGRITAPVAKAWVGAILNSNPNISQNELFEVLRVE